jgi:formylmethanofuran dehydrogenase subunit D
LSLGEFLFPRLELTLVIAYSSDTEIKATRGKNSEEYTESAARIRMNESDLKRLNLKEHDTVSVKNKIGNIVVRAYIDSSINSGTALMPYSPWALALVDVASDLELIQLHGIRIEVSKTDEEISSLDEILDFV